MSTSHISRGRRYATAGFAACLAAGAATMAFGAGATSPHGNAAGRPADPSPVAESLGPSMPTRITIQRLGMAVGVVDLRASADGRTLALPPLRQTGWDSTSVTPGQAGITVITGYISRTAKQPGALKSIDKLKDGDVITVDRKDSKQISYRVTGVDYYAKGTFPAAKVFPQTRVPELRLISTGGPLHKGDPLGNALVTAVAATPDPADAGPTDTGPH